MRAYVFSLVLCRISGTSIFIIMIFCSFQPRLILIISIFRFSLRVRFQFRCYFFVLFCSLLILCFSPYIYMDCNSNGIVEIVAHHFLSNARMRLFCFYIIFFFLLFLKSNLFFSLLTLFAFCSTKCYAISNKQPIQHVSDAGFSSLHCITA